MSRRVLRLFYESESEVAQSCTTLSDPMDCSPPGSSAHGIFQARVLEWGAIAFSGIVFLDDHLYNHSISSFSWNILTSGWYTQCQFAVVYVGKKEKEGGREKEGERERDRKGEKESIKEELRLGSQLLQDQRGADSINDILYHFWYINCPHFHTYFV